MGERHDGFRVRRSEAQPELVSALDLFERFRRGEDGAIDLLLERSLPPLKRWARGRLPAWALAAADSQELVQSAVMRTLPRLKNVEIRHPGALQAYLRQAI